MWEQREPRKVGTLASLSRYIIRTSGSTRHTKRSSRVNSVAATPAASAVADALAAPPVPVVRVTWSAARLGPCRALSGAGEGGGAELAAVRTRRLRTDGDRDDV